MIGRSTVAIGRLAVTMGAVFPIAAGAATLCVSPDGAGCHTTIQGAVDAAAAGDIIRVGPGVYFENVVVPEDQIGLRIEGERRDSAVIDPDAPNGGTAIRVEADRVELASLTIRNGRQYGVAVASGVEGVLIHRLRFVGGRGPAAILAEPGSTRLRIVSNEVRAAGVVGIHLSGGNDASLVRSNGVMQVDSGIVAFGVAVQVAFNRVAGTHAYGVRVEGPRARVEGNVVEGAMLLPSAGLEVVGADPIVRHNRLDSAGTAIVSCVSCAGGLVAGNSSVGSFGPDYYAGGIGLQVSADAPGLVVRDNRVSRAIVAAFLVEGVGVRVLRNLAIDTGSPDSGDGFLVRGVHHELARNLATRCSASGFRIESDEANVEANVATDSGLNGFLVFGAMGTNGGNVLRRNTVVGANAAGFAVVDDALSTTLTGNRASGTRYDFCDEGVGTDSAAGNHFSTTSTVCDVTR